MIAAALLVCPPAGNAAAPFVFGSPVLLPTAAGSPAALAVGDFNGDGRDDLAIARIHDFAINMMELNVHLQDGEGRLGAPLRFERPSRFGTVQQADLDGNGVAEILLGHQTGLAVYRWDGMSFRHTDYPGQYRCEGISTADIDGDGAQDALCLGDGGDVMLYYSHRTTTFGPPEYWQTPAWSGAGGQTQLKDVTGDGRPDLLLATRSTSHFFVHPHDGRRGFEPAIAYTLYGETSTGIEVFDFDRDGVEDILIGQYCADTCAQIQVFKRGDSRGGIEGYFGRADYYFTLDYPASFLATDIDADGHQDLLVQHHAYSTIGRYPGGPSGLSTSELWTSVWTGGARGLATGDLNHDGYKDLAVASGNRVSVVHGGHARTSDFNGDFKSDLVWRNAAGQMTRWHSANRTEAFEMDQRDPAWVVQAIGNFEGDGAADIFWRNLGTGENEITSQSGSLIDPPNRVSSQDWQVVGAGDFDGDGRSDLLWRNGRTGANSIWLSASVNVQQTIASVPDLRWRVAGIGDFDGDRRADILWRHFGTGQNAVWRSGRQDQPLATRAVSDLRWTVVGVGDFNGDGKDDIVWRHTSSGSNSIWLSANGATQMAVAAVTSQSWAVAAIGDYDGDGRSDIMWRNTSTGGNSVWRSGDVRQSLAVASLAGWSVVH